MPKARKQTGRNEGKARQKAKAWNITPSMRLRMFVEEFKRLNDRASATAVVEEALREFFEKRGIKTDVDPAELLRSILAEKDEK